MKQSLLLGWSVAGITAAATFGTFLHLSAPQYAPIVSHAGASTKAVGWQDNRTLIPDRPSTAVAIDRTPLLVGPASTTTSTVVSSTAGSPASYTPSSSVGVGVASGNNSYPTSDSNNPNRPNSPAPNRGPNGGRSFNPGMAANTGAAQDDGNGAPPNDFGPGGPGGPGGFGGGPGGPGGFGGPGGGGFGPPNGGPGGGANPDFPDLD